MSLQLLQDVARMYYAAINTPVSYLLDWHARTGDWGAVISHKNESPDLYPNALSYHLDNLAVTLLKKCNGLEVEGVDPEQEAKDNWILCERQCYWTNRRLRDESLSDEAAELKHQFFRGVTRNFYKLVGKPPTLAEMSSIRFGPGSVVETIRGLTSLPDKIASQPMLTSNALVYRSLLAETAWGRREALFPNEHSTRFKPVHFIEQDALEMPSVAMPHLVTKGNKWSSVDKTALTKRSIGIEPGGNLSIQMSIGTKLRVNLNRFGFLLKPTYQKWWGGLWLTTKAGDSQELHRRLAKKASIDGTLATEDARNASDTICTELVKLGTGEWADLFMASRSPYTMFPTKKGGARAPYFLEKISSMGNGFTFELETALFAAIAMTVADKAGVQLIPNVNFSVYGDDIIVPSELAKMVESALEYCGIQMNKEKSFSVGPFRESCGGDYYSGVAVRGLYVKNVPQTPGDLIVLHNLIVRASDYIEVGNILRLITDYIPSNLRNYGPPELGDIVLHHRNWERKAKWRTTSDGWRQLRVTVPGPQSYSLERWDTISVLIAKLYGMEGDEITPRPRDDDIVPFYAKWVEFG